MVKTRIAFLAFLLSAMICILAALNFGKQLVPIFDLLRRSAGGEVALTTPTVEASSPEGDARSTPSPREGLDDLRWNIYVNDVVRYSIKYPSGMEISTFPLGGVPDAGVSFVMFGSTQAPQSGFNDGIMGDIVLNSTTKLRSVDKYLSDPSNDFPLPGPKRKQSVVGGATAIWTEGEERVDETIVSFANIYVSHPEGILIITASFAGPQMPRYRDVFDQIVSSFSFLPQRKP